MLYVFGPDHEPNDMVWQKLHEDLGIKIVTKENEQTVSTIVY